MVDIDIEELDEGEQESGSQTEAVEEEKSITDEIREMQEKKMQPQEEVKKEKPKRNIDLTKLNTFKTKLKEHFGLKEKEDKHGCYALYYNRYILIKLLPRKNCWYGVWKEMPEENNKWRAIRVYSQEDEDAVYDHVKKLVEINSKTN